MEQPEELKQEINIVKKALLIEDYVPCQKIMTHYLHQLDYEVDLVDDSLTAIENIESKTYDLIIEDINLHGNISGTEVIQKIRNSKLNIGTPVLVWTAYANKNEEKYLTRGADGALIKVCQIRELKKAIERCFLKTRYHRKLHYQLQNFKNKWDRFFNEAQLWKDSECINQFKFSLHEAIIIIEEHQHRLKFHGIKE